MAPYIIPNDQSGFNIMDEKWLENIIRKHQEDGLISQVLEVKTVPAVANGENFSSVVDRTSLKAVLRSGRKANLSYIIKKYPETDGMDKFLQETEAFKVEIEVYINVLKEMENLMAEQETIQDKIWPELIGYRTYDRLIIQDLTIENYKIISRRNCQDIHYSRLVMAELGRFHAMGKVLLARGKINENDYKPWFMSNRTLFKKTVYSSILKLAEIMKESWGAEWADISDRLAKYAHVLLELVPSLAKTSHKKFKVLDHGDPWTCNMLFKHTEYDNKPIAVRLIDFQYSHVDSLGWDLMYFMYSSIEADCRRQNFTELLKIYSDVYIKTLQSMQIPQCDIPTYEEIVAEMERLRPIQVVVMCFAHVIIGSDCSDSFDLEACLNSNGEDIVVTPKPDCYRDEVFKNRVGPELKELVRIGFL